MDGSAAANERIRARVARAEFGSSFVWGGGTDRRIKNRRVGLAHEARVSPGTQPGSESMATITKKDLVDRISARMTNCPRADVKLVIQSFLDSIIDELGKGNRLEFRDFGVFEVKERAARVAQNPKTLVPVKVPPKRTVKFKVGRLMKDQLETRTTSRPAAQGTPQVVVNPDLTANGRVPTKSPTTNT